VLAKPSGPSLLAFLDQHGAEMYSAPFDVPSSRILPEYRPLAYQWVLNFISGLAFVHGHDVIFGDPDLTQCWLSSDLRLSLVGFINAGFLDKERWSRVVEGDWSGIYGEYPDGRNPTKTTDLVLFGYTVYELMTAYWPAIRSSVRPWKKSGVDVPRHQWPRLETEYMGDIVRKCCKGEYTNANDVKVVVVDFLEDLGWEVDEDDNLKGFDATGLFK
jgi:serine/threonine protein kinase